MTEEFTVGRTDAAVGSCGRDSTPGGGPMAWYWTDDMARLLLERGLVPVDRVGEWISRPVAFAGPTDADPVQVALLLMGDAAAVA